MSFTYWTVIVTFREFWRQHSNFVPQYFCPFAKFGKVLKPKLTQAVTPIHPNQQWEKDWQVFLFILIYMYLSFKTPKYKCLAAKVKKIKTFFWHSVNPPSPEKEIERARCMAGVPSATASKLSSSFLFSPLSPPVSISLLSSFSPTHKSLALSPLKRVFKSKHNNTFLFYDQGGFVCFGRIKTKVKVNPKR